MQTVVHCLTIVKPSWCPTAGIPHPDVEQYKLSLVDAVPFGSELLWVVNCLPFQSLSPQLSSAMQLSHKVPHTVTVLALSLWFLLPHPAVPHLCAQHLSANSSLLWLSFPNQKAWTEMASLWLAACTWWTVKAGISGKVWKGKVRLSKHCGCEASWRSSGTWENSWCFMEVMVKRWRWGITTSSQTWWWSSCILYRISRMMCHGARGQDHLKKWLFFYTRWQEKLYQSRIRSQLSKGGIREDAASGSHRIWAASFSHTALHVGNEVPDRCIMFYLVGKCY